MKKSLLALIVTFTSTVYADTLIKSCKTTTTMPEGPTVETQIDILSKNGKIYATVNQNGSAYTEKIVNISEYSIRDGLAPEMIESEEMGKLNLGESLIVHAMTLESDPILEGQMSSGIDLNKVKSVKVYVVGKTSNMGLTAIVEAKDASQKLLGSFFGGFLLSPCK
ncbi:MAG: hypothetical protein AB7I27_15140 [Bacteriovoracaceae bacterium]